MHDVKIDTLVLGCTHYPLLRHVIADVMGDSVTLIDSGEETAKVAHHQLAAAGLLSTTSSDTKGTGQHKFFVSDVPEKFSQVATRFLGEVIEKITRVDISGY